MVKNYYGKGNIIQAEIYALKAFPDKQALEVLIKISIDKKDFAQADKYISIF